MTLNPAQLLTLHHSVVYQEILEYILGMSITSLLVFLNMDFAFDLYPFHQMDFCVICFYIFSFSLVISFSIYISVRHSLVKSNADIALVWMRIEELLIDVYVTIRFCWTVQKWGSSDVHSKHQILHILPTPNLVNIILRLSTTFFFFSTKISILRHCMWVRLIMLCSSCYRTFAPFLLLYVFIRTQYLSISN